MKKTLFLWLALGATTTAFAQSPDGITGASAVQTGQTKNKGESIIYKGNTTYDWKDGKNRTQGTGLPPDTV